jgi:hypothetical protein
VQAIIDFLNNNDKKNYNIIRSEGTRRLPITITHPNTSELYHAFVATLYDCYDIQLDENALPRITSNTQLPGGHMFPKSSEPEFCAELIKVR